MAAEQRERHHAVPRCLLRLHEEASGELRFPREAGVGAWLEFTHELLRRHLSGDWGELDAHDRRENARSLKHGFRVLSSYRVGGQKVWIITEADRSSTCLLLPSEY